MSNPIKREIPVPFEITLELSREEFGAWLKNLVSFQ